jgi:hypothetical protein
MLRAVLPPDRFRLVWELRDTEEALALAERRLRERQLVEALAWHLPDSAPAIRAAARHLAEHDVADQVG